MRLVARVCVAWLAFLVPVASMAEEPPPVVPTPEVGPSRLFFSPTARSLPRGRGTVALSELAFPWVEYGIWDRVSIQAIGFPPLPDLTGPGGLVLGPKVQVVRTPRFQAAVGAYEAIAWDQGPTGGFAYGVVTAGGTSTGFTLGYGIGYGEFADDDPQGGSAGVLFMGVDKSLGQSVRLMAEGLFAGTGSELSEATLVGAVRLTKGRWSVDLGVVVPIYETGAGTPFPLLTVAWGF